MPPRGRESADVVPNVTAVLDDIQRPIVPAGNLEANTLFGFLRDDFASIWDALCASQAESSNGANFTLGLLATVLLELCSRIASSSDHAYRWFSDALGEEDPRYYAELPFESNLPRRFKLPAASVVPPERQLLSVIFDLVRNGQAHQYQQVVGLLDDGRLLGIQLTGVDRGGENARFDDLLRWPLTRPADHLALDIKQRTGNIWLRVRPEILFKDVQRAAERSGLFNGMLQLDYLSGPQFAADSDAVVKTLQASGILRLADHPTDRRVRA